MYLGARGLGTPRRGGDPHGQRHKQCQAEPRDVHWAGGKRATRSNDWLSRLTVMGSQVPGA